MSLMINRKIHSIKIRIKSKELIKKRKILKSNFKPMAPLKLLNLLETLRLYLKESERTPKLLDIIDHPQRSRASEKVTLLIEKAEPEECKIVFYIFSDRVRK